MTATNFNLEFENMEKEIRYAVQPDNPVLVATYISLAIYESESMALCRQKLQLLNRVANTLLETLCDTYLPEHWRRTCMDVIYRPIQAMEKIASTDKSRYQLTRLKYEVKVMGEYFL